jgi:type IV pilus assembly protein PilO
MKKQPWMSIALLIAIVAGLIYFVYFKPRQADLKSFRAERIALEDELTLLRSKKRQLDRIEAELAKLGASLAELETIIPRKREQSEMVRNVQQMALDAGIETVLRIAPDREVNKDFYSEWPIPIEVIGNFHTLGAFFDRILHFPRIFNIDDFSITSLPSQSADITISARFTARTYFFLDESLIKKPEPAPKAKKPGKETNEI